MPDNTPDNTQELQAAVEEHVYAVHLSPRTFLAQDADERDPSQIPSYLHSLQDLVDWLNAEVKGKLPLTVWRNLILESIALRDEIHACYQGLLHTPTAFTSQAEKIALPQGGYVLDINIEALQQLTAIGFTDQEIADHLGCSRRTVYRRRQAVQPMNKRQAKHLASEDILRQAITNHQAEHDGPMLGYRTIQGHLNSQGILVTREQVRELNRELNPGSTALRRAVLRTRRVYKVPFPNSLWHIDGQHKLIRWKFVIHGGVDGYSRTCVFMHASDNNRAENVERLFLQATQAWGWPQRVRVDYGGENNGIWKQMIAIRGKQHCSSNMFRLRRLIGLDV